MERLPFDAIATIARMVPVHHDMLREVCHRFSQAVKPRRVEGLILAAAQEKHWNVVKWGYARGYPNDEDAVELIIEAGQLEILRDIRRCGHTFPRNAHEIAVKAGQLDVLRWLRRKNNEPINNLTNMVVASQNNRLDAFKYLYVHGGCNTTHSIKMDDIIANFAEHGNDDAITWIEKVYGPIDDVRKICVNAVRNNHDAMFWKYYPRIVKGSDLNELRYALLERGLLTVVQKVFVDHGVPTEIRTNAAFAFHAAKSGNLELLRWLHDMGARFDETAYVPSGPRGSENPYVPKGPRGSENPYVNSPTTIGMFQWLHQRGIACREWTYNTMVAYGDVTAMKWLYEKGIPFNKWTLRFAIRRGHLPAVQWLYEQGCEYDDFMPLEAMEKGHLHILRWIHGMGLPLNGVTLAEKAEEYRHWKIIRWLLDENLLIEDVIKYRLLLRRKDAGGERWA